ncbi:alpha/beta fold hydrolase [Microbacterium gorillae]|uniref:alpha/beta fold hydrolase n=1 Tax=Microbacterium gorillae TaxID=1231063 RepID=UPI00058E3025|nr:alpha/beta fold hydrolase [Microbacterium gorillae]
MPEYTDEQGVVIVYDVHPATGPVRGVVQLAHGVGEHAGRYGALVGALTAGGFHVYADDHRGHGRTGMKQWNGDATKLGRLGPGGLNAAVAAVGRLSEIAHGDHPDLPLILLGHSWGSMIAQKLLAAHPERYAAVVLSGSALLTPTELNAAPLNKKWAGPDATGLEWLSRDPAVQQAFRDDPLTTETPLLKLFGVIEAFKLYGRPPRDLGTDVPLLLMVGSEDPVGGPRSVHRLADEYRTRSGLTDVTVLVYPDDRHEIFNELDQERVRADLLAWLTAHVRAPERSAEPDA